MSLSNSILDRCKLIRWGFNLNSWIWFHIYGGIVIAQVVYLLGGSFLQAIICSILIALVWEGIEVLWGMYQEYLKGYRSDLFQRFCKSTYGPVPGCSSVCRWKYDSLGDILGTVIATALSSIYLLGVFL